MDAAFVLSAFGQKDFPSPEHPEIAFAGRSNVGKSSLINMLCERRGMAKTSGTPGRTRSINFYSVGRSLTFADLPGYGFARVPEEVRRSWGRLVETYLEFRPNLRAVLVILDIRRDPAEGDLSLLTWLCHFRRRALPVFTKTDKLSGNECRARVARLRHAFEAIPVDPPLFVSARTREGREALWEWIREVTAIP